VLLSAIAGKAARRVFEVEPPLDVITTEATIAEVEEYLPEFVERYGLDLGTLQAALALLPVRRFSESDYVSHRFGPMTTISRNCQTLGLSDSQAVGCSRHLFEIATSSDKA
jgi:hypothetical protein